MTPGRFGQRLIVSARSELNKMADPTLRAAIERHQLAVFLVGTVVLGSLATALLATIPTDPLILPLVAVPLSYIPAALAVLLLRLGRDADERVALRHRLTAWRVGLRWYIVAVVLVPAASPGRGRTRDFLGREVPATS